MESKHTTWGFTKGLREVACETAERSASDRRPLKRVASAGTIYFYAAASRQISLAWFPDITLPPLWVFIHCDRAGGLTTGTSHLARTRKDKANRGRATEADDTVDRSRSEPFAAGTSPLDLASGTQNYLQKRDLFLSSERLLVGNLSLAETGDAVPSSLQLVAGRSKIPQKASK